MRPPLDGQLAAQDHVIGHCMGKAESMPLILVGGSLATFILSLRTFPDPCCAGAAGFGKTSVLASVVSQLLQEKHSMAYSKVKLPMYALFRSVGLTEFSCDPTRVLDSILLEVHAAIERKPTPESLETSSYHDCVLQMSHDALNATMHRLPALVDLGAVKGTANWKQLVSTLYSLPRGKPVALIIDNAHAVMPFQMWTRIFAAPLPPHVKVVLSFTEDAGTLESIMADIASLPLRWQVYQLSSMLAVAPASSVHRSMSHDVLLTLLRSSTDAVLALETMSSSLSLHNSLTRNEPSRAKTLVAADLMSPEPVFRLQLRYACALAGSFRPIGYVCDYCFSLKHLTFLQS